MKRIKSAVSVFLCILMLLGVFSFGASAQSGDTSVYVATDLHFKPTSVTGGLNPDKETDIPDALYYHADALGKMLHESTAIVQAMLDEVAASDVEYLLLAGDLTDGPSRVCHTALAEMFREFEATSGKSIYLIPGNHDAVYERTSTSVDLDEFVEIYADFGFNEALEKDKASASYTADIGGDYRLLAIDSNNFETGKGDISAETLQWIGQQAEKAEKDGVHLVAMMHHSLLDHFTFNTLISGGFATNSTETLATTFADWGIKYVFTGHLHVNDITQATTSNGNKIYDVATGMLIGAPNMFRKVTFTESKVIFEACYVDEIDVSYLPDGYSDDQLALISSDFATYSDNYCKYGLYNWPRTFLTSKNLLKGMAQDDPVYVAVDGVLSKVGEVIRMPLYTNDTPELDTIEEVAALSGITLEKSDYESAIDIIYVFVGGFYSGDSNIPLDSLEGRILFNVIKAALTYTIGQCTDPTSLGKGLNKILVDNGVSEAAAAGLLITGSVSQLVFTETAANAVIESLIRPILEGFSADAYAPADLNVELDAYNSGKEYFPDGGVPLTLWQKFIAFLKTIYEAIATLLNNI